MTSVRRSGWQGKLQIEQCYNQNARQRLYQELSDYLSLRALRTKELLTPRSGVGALDEDVAEEQEEDAESDGKKDPGEHLEAGREEPEIPTEDVEQGGDEDGAGAPAEAAILNDGAENKEEQGEEGPAEGEIAGVVAGEYPGADKDPVGEDGEDGEGPGFDAGDEGVALVAEQRGLAKEEEHGDAVDDGGHGEGLSLEIIEVDPHADGGEDKAAADAEGAELPDAVGEDKGAEEEEDAHLGAGIGDEADDEAREGGDRDEEVEVDEKANGRAPGVGEIGEIAEPFVGHLGGDVDDHRGDGGGPPRPGEDVRIRREEEVVEREDEEELADNGETPDAGEGAVDEEDEGEETGADDPTLGVEVGADGEVSEIGQGERVEEGDAEGPGAGTGDALAGPPGQQKERDGRDGGGAPPGEFLTILGREDDEDERGDEEDLRQGGQFVEGEVVDDVGEDEGGEGEGRRERGIAELGAQRGVDERDGEDAVAGGGEDNGVAFHRAVADFAAGIPRADEHDERADEAEEPRMMRVNGDFPEEKDRGEKGGGVGADGEDAVAGERARDADEEGLDEQEHGAGHAGEDHDDAGGEEREALRGVGAHDVDGVDVSEAGEAGRDEKDDAGVEEGPADSAGTVAGDVGGEGHQDGEQGVIEGEDEKADGATEIGFAGDDDSGREDEPREGEIDGVGREGKRAAGIEDDVAVGIDEEAVEQREIGADDAECGERGPAVADEEDRSGGGEDKIDAHGEPADRRDGGADVGDDDGEDGEGLGFLFLGKAQDVDRPGEENHAGDERAGDDLDGIEKTGGVGGQIKPSERDDGDGAADEEGTFAFSFHAVAPQDGEEADDGADGKKAGVADGLLDFRHGENQGQRDDGEKEAHADEQAAEVNFGRARSDGSRRLGEIGRDGRKREAGHFCARGGNGGKQRLDRERRQGGLLKTDARAGFERAKLRVKLLQRLLEVRLLAAQRLEEVAIFGCHCSSLLCRLQRLAQVRREEKGISCEVVMGSWRAKVVPPRRLISLRPFGPAACGQYAISDLDSG